MTEQGSRYLTGHTALVTASSRNLGAAIAGALANVGADVIVTYHQSPDAAQELIARFPDGAHAAVPGDMSTADGVKDMVEAVQNADYMMARKLHLEMLEFHTAMFIESNPVPVKKTLELMGKLQANVRLPLVDMGDEKLERLKAVLRSYKII